mmetsp:Transcript_20543/g.78736  ORF Transcript_20543/g.78736 Transcript_20543/m.78736 type:complete len:342 (+) Transcript_20543:675-1700(+)
MQLLLVPLLQRSISFLLVVALRNEELVLELAELLLEESLLLLGASLGLLGAERLVLLEGLELLEMLGLGGLHLLLVLRSARLVGGDHLLRMLLHLHRLLADEIAHHQLLRLVLLPHLERLQSVHLLERRLVLGRQVVQLDPPLLPELPELQRELLDEDVPLQLLEALRVLRLQLLLPLQVLLLLRKEQLPLPLLLLVLLLQAVLLVCLLQLLDQLCVRTLGVAVTALLLDGVDLLGEGVLLGLLLLAERAGELLLLGGVVPVEFLPELLGHGALRLADGDLVELDLALERLLLLLVRGALLSELCESLLRHALADKEVLLLVGTALLVVRPSQLLDAPLLL